ncbi:MAG: HNH endonuclease [Bacilli bacterium]|nr:HNH endonuclease [Bacilli bacterium]
MMQAALRVSYTSPKVMHWITETLEYLTSINNVSISQYRDKVERIIINNIVEVIKEYNKPKDNDNFIIDKENKYFCKGVEIHHIIFNYLDYLLWENNKQKFKSFRFEFRNSVEHFYPQNPKGFDKWKNKKELNYFGNLCLVSKSFNSELSNNPPSVKVAKYKNQIKKGSLKLQTMAECIKTIDDNKKWKEQLSKEHGDKMLEILLKKLNQE